MSKLPLRVAAETPSRIETADGWHFGIEWKDTSAANPYGEAEEFAAFIVRAVNSYDALVSALLAYQAADAADAAMLETIERATAEDWSNDPTGSLHVNSACQRYHDALRHANELREAALAALAAEKEEAA